MRGIIAWFASNHVAANLLMLFIIVAGLISVASIRKETMPEFEIPWIQVRVAYLGAAPQEVEEGVVIKIEEAVQDIAGVKTIRSRAREGMGSVTIEAALDAALDQLGVHEDEVEFEVVQEAKSGLFGRIGGNPARIRARVKPLSREKPGDRGRGRGGRPCASGSRRWWCR